MSARLHFYRKLLPDGTTRSICLHCFETIGTKLVILDLAELEAVHSCYAHRGSGDRRLGVRTIFRSAALRHFNPFFKKLTLFRRISFVVACVLLFYALPTFCEFLLLRFSDSWLACVVFGNLIGCVAIGMFKHRAGYAALLYLGLMAIDMGIYGSHLIGAQQLPWILDIVPTIALAVLAVRMKQSTASPASA